MSVAVSIVIPCYNEEKRLEPGLSEAMRFFSDNLRDPFEIIFVDDGSGDRTGELLAAFKERNPKTSIRIVRYKPNRGKGYAVKTGMLAARGEKVITMDSDFSVDLREIQKFIDALDSADVAIGTKKHLLTQCLKSQSLVRRFLGKGFTRLTDLVLRMDFTDITCGMKAFRGPAARRLFSKQTLERWSYDSEILFLAKRFGYKSVEIPVRWSHVEGGKVSAVKDTIRSFWELLVILRNYYTGKYKDGDGVSS